jgi:uncharacterized membrane protein
MADDRDEDEEQEVIEFLNELRVVLPGVQVLFAFLLTVPFTNRFERLSSADRGVYFAALLLAAGASVLLIAPSLHARLTWPDRDKQRLLVVSNRLAVAGSVLLAGAMACSVYLVADLLYRSRVGGAVAAGVVVVTMVVWYGIPLTDGRMKRH